MPWSTASYRLPTFAQDLALALFVTFVQVQGVRGATASSDVVARPIEDLGSLGYVLLLVSGLSLAARRRWPLAVVAVTAGASAAYYAVDFHDGPTWVSLFVALYTLTAYGDGRRSVLAAGAVIAGLSVVWIVSGADVEPRAALGWVFFRVGASVMSAALGESVRTRRVIATEALARAELAERTREEEARARVDEERLRIAREVHDTVAHAIAIINVQAGVSAHVLDKRPQQARAALEAIAQTSSRALQEMRTVLGVLRDDEGRSPNPGLDRLDELVEKGRAAGLDLEVVGHDSVRGLPSAVTFAAYRILQESITNVIRHVGPSRVTVTLEQDDRALTVSVTDGGGMVGGPGAPEGTGRGIDGMRERCALLGGELLAAPLPDGGFAVRAVLPLAPVEAAR